MNKEIVMVEQFHRAFGAPIALMPTMPPEDRLALRCRLILEEALEFVEAAGFAFCIPVPGQFNHVQVAMRYDNGLMLEDATLEKVEEPNFIEMCDALRDIQVVVHGTDVEMGTQGFAQEQFYEVMRSNMSKLGEDGKPVRRADGKIMKGPHYFKPDLRRFFIANDIAIPGEDK